MYFVCTYIRKCIFLNKRSRGNKIFLHENGEKKLENYKIIELSKLPQTRLRITESSQNKQ